MTETDYTALLDAAATELAPAIERAERKHKTVDATPMGVSFAELGARPMRPDFVVHGLIPSAGVGVLSGEPKRGKSWLALHLALSIAGGKNAFERFAIHRPHLAFYVTEDGADMTAARCRALVAGHALSGRWADRLHVAAEKPLNIMSTPALCVLAANVRRTEIELGEKAGLVIIDPISVLSADTTAAIARLRALGGMLGCPVMFVDYPDDEPSARDRAIRTGVDFAINLDRPRGDRRTEFVSRASCELKMARASRLDVRLRIEDDAEGFAAKATFAAEDVDGISTASLAENRAMVIVSRLFKHNAPMTYDQLHREIGGARQIIGRALEIAEKEDWIRQRVHNGRKAGFELTDKGRELVREEMDAQRASP